MFSEDAFRRYDETLDSLFYAQPRFVTHIDEGAVAAVTQVYRERFAPDSDVLDVMSSWMSHLPPEIAYRRVFGLGMNEAELAANPRLNGYVLHDLNARPYIPLETATFDVAAICVSIQYLTQPVAATTARSSFENKMLPGFKSRWTTPPGVREINCSSDGTQRRDKRVAGIEGLRLVGC